MQNQKPSLFKINTSKNDLISILTSKVTNSITTAGLFTFVAREFGSNIFSLFGYWWSIAIMIGGIFLGGVGSATVRSVAVSRSLKPALDIGKRFLLFFFVLIVLIYGVICLFVPNKTDQLVFILTVTAFGLSVMIQNVTFGLIRAMGDLRSNTISSLVVVLLTPILTWMIMGVEPSLTRIFFSLVVAFNVGTIICVMIAWRSLRDLFRMGNDLLYSQNDFGLDVLIFTAVNLLSYLSVNMDFTLIKIHSTESEFSILANEKIYFERFVLPILLTFAGAISLRILRSNRKSRHSQYFETLHLKPIYLIPPIALVLVISLGDWVFNAIMETNNKTIGFAWASVAGIGYLSFAVNAILLDLLAIQSKIKSIFWHVAIFIIFGASIQWFMFVVFRVPGWAIGWTLFNAVVTARLIQVCIKLKFVFNE